MERSEWEKGRCGGGFPRAREGAKGSRDRIVEVLEGWGMVRE